MKDRYGADCLRNLDDLGGQPAQDWCHLTTRHKLQGRGSVGKPCAAGSGCLRAEKTDGRALSA
jgi:hypothetical protein